MRSLLLLAAAITLAPLGACSDADQPAAAASAAPAPAIPIAAAELPQIRPGRWLMRTVDFKGDKATRELLNEEPEFVCIAPGTSILDTTDTDLSKCSQRAISRTGAGVSVEAQCETADIKSSIKSVYSGDFKTVIRADVELGMAAAGQPMETVRIGLEGRYQGPCTGDEG